MANIDVRTLGLENVEPYELAGSHVLYAIEPPPMLIEDVQPRGTITALTAKPGVGKTWFALEMSRAVLTGTPFLGAFPAEQGAVLFVGSDSSMHDYARQWRRLTVRDWTRLAPDESTEEDYENPFDTNIRFLIQSDFMIDNRDTVRRIIRTCQMFEWGPVHQVEYFNPKTGQSVIGVERRKGFDLIIMDTYSKLTRADQNSNTLTEENFRNLRLITEITGASIIVLHHNAAQSEFNDGEGWRGATAGAGALDNHIQLNQTSFDKYVLRMEFKKFRGITPESCYYKMLVNDEEQASLVHVKDEEVETKKFDDSLLDGIIGWLRTPACRGQWFSIKQISDALHPSFAEFYPEAEKFVRSVRGKLSEERKHAKPRIVTEGGGRRGSQLMFMAAPFEEVVNEEEIDATV